MVKEFRKSPSSPMRGDTTPGDYRGASLMERTGWLCARVRMLRTFFLNVVAGFSPRSTKIREMRADARAYIYGGT